MQKLFNKAIQDFLDDRYDEAVSLEESPQYQKADREIDQLHDEIKALLSEEAQKILLKLDDRHNDRMTAAGNAAYQKGFAEGIQFIIHVLIS